MRSDQGKLRPIFVAMAAILLASAATIFFAGHRTIWVNEQVVARQAVIDDLQLFFSTIQDAETGQRGYLLTGEDSYLEPYEAARLRVHAQMARVRGAVDGGWLDRRDVAELFDFSGRKLRELERTIALRHDAGLDSAMRVVAHDDGRHFMNAIRERVGMLQNEQRAAVLRLRQQASGWSATRSAVIAAAVLVTLAFLAWAYRRLSRDAAERARATEEVARQKEHFRVTLSSIGDAVIVADPNGRITFVNQAAERLTGWPAQDAIGRSLAEVFRIIAEDTRHAVESPADKVLRDGVVVGLANHTLLVRRDGEEVPIDDCGAPIRSAEGKVLGVVLVFRDVTSERRGAQLMAESEARHRAVFNSAVAGIITIDEAGIIESANPSAERMFGFAVDEMVGKNVAMLMPSSVRRGHDLHMASFRTTGEPRIIGIGREVLGQRKDGSTFPIEIAVSEVHIGGRRLYTGVIEDISKRKQSEHERETLLQAEQTARADAERANRAKDEFLAALSHELRTPLTPSLFVLSMLLEDADLPAKFRGDVESIRHHIELEARLIDDLLDLTRVTTGRLKLSKKQVDLHTVIRNALQIAKQDAGLAQEIDLSAVDHYVDADPARLQQVFWNLLSNAHKFTPLGGHVTIRTSNPQPVIVRAEVVDTGRGIEKELLGRVFDAFEQGETSTARQFGGLGLGLAISRQIVHAHGGQITAHSAGKGRGATFAVELATSAAPAWAVPAPSTSIDAVEKERSSSGPTASPPVTAPPKKLRVLVVEDHEPTLKLLARVLQLLGHEPATASNVQSAIAAANASPFDLLISDLGLPDGSGCDVMRYVRQHFGLRGIALSGFGMSEDIDRSHEAGFALHLTKPIDMNRLAAAISETSVAAEEPARPA